MAVRVKMLGGLTVLAAAVVLSWALSTGTNARAAFRAPQDSPSGASVTDLGAGVLVSESADPAVVAGSVDVVVYGSQGPGIWRNGTVSDATGPDGTFTPVAVNSQGIVLGNVVTGTRQVSAGGGAYDTVTNYAPAYWDSLHLSTYTVISLAGLSVNGAAVVSGGGAGIDAAGDIVGGVNDAAEASNADYAGLYIPASGGVPAGTPQVISSQGGTGIFSLGGIGAGYELELGSDRISHLYNRITGANTTTDLAPEEQSGVSFASNGAVAGHESTGSGAAVIAPGGSDVILQVPAGGTGGSVTFAVNSSETSVGETFTGANANVLAAVSWNAQGAPTYLRSTLASGSPWTLQQAMGVDDAGDIVGDGLLNGTEDGWLIAGSTTITRPVVNSSGDAGVENNGANGCNTGQTVTLNGISQPECTLRAAIQAENAGSVSQATISFALAAGSQISPETPLPALTASGVTISGAGISLDGHNTVVANSVGLELAGSHDAVSGITLALWTIGIKLDGAGGGDSVTGTNISNTSTGQTGTITLGVDVENSPNSVIGGSGATSANTITKEVSAVFIRGTAATGTTVQGNQLGVVNAAVADGVTISDASNTTVGGPSSRPGVSPGNSIDSSLGSGVNVVGISATVTGTTIAGNSIGLSSDGTARVGGPNEGVLIAGSVGNTMIGGSANGAGNAIVGAHNADVDIDGTAVTGTQMLQNLIGTNAQGSATLDGGESLGVEVQGASRTQIGAAGAGNLITGAQQDGVSISASTGKVVIRETGAVAPGTTTTQTSSMGTDVADNTIGPLADGRTLPAQIQDIGVFDNGTGDTIGPANEISGNQVGVTLKGTHTELVGNRIGLDATGLAALPNVIGVYVPTGAGKDIQIGAAGARHNTISGNGATQVLLGAAASLQGNLIGTTTSGSAAADAYSGKLPDALMGKQQAAAVMLDKGVSVTTTIGGTAAGAGNVISGNHSGAILLLSPAVVQGNRIGVGLNANTPIANDGVGVIVERASILGANPLKPAAGANVIAHDTQGGVVVDRGGGPVSMVSDTMTANGNFAIHHEDAGAPTPPGLSAVLDADGHGTRVAFAAGAAPAGSVVQIYRASGCDSAGAQGETLLASVHLSKPQAAGSTVLITLKTQAVGSELTATLTTGLGADAATSRYGGCVTVARAPSSGNAAVDGSTVVVPIGCSGAQGCSGITVEETVSTSAARTDLERADVSAASKTKARKVTRTIVVAKTTLSLKAHHRARVHLHLNAAGRRLLARAGRGKLAVQLQIRAHTVLVAEKTLTLRRGKAAR